MPCISMLTTVVAESGRLIRKEAGPAIFVQCQVVMLPSGSYEAVPFSNTLSVGKVISWSCPVTAMGGLLLLLHPSQEFSFLQDVITIAVILSTTDRVNKVLFISIRFKVPCRAVTNNTVNFKIPFQVSVWFHKRKLFIEGRDQSLLP